MDYRRAVVRKRKVVHDMSGWCERVCVYAEENGVEIEVGPGSGITTQSDQ